MPSPLAALTSAPCFSSVRTASRSLFIAASATGDDDGAAPSHAVIANAAPIVSTRFIRASQTKQNRGVRKERRERSALRAPRFLPIRLQREGAGAVPERLDVVEPQLVH